MIRSHLLSDNKDKHISNDPTSTEEKKAALEISSKEKEDIINSESKIEYSEGEKHMNKLAKMLGVVNEKVEEIGDSQKAILVVGNTGVGKSTLMLNLAGENMEAYIPEGLNSYKLVPVDPEAKKKVSSQYQKHTEVPVIKKEKNNPKIVYIDTPGFLDTEGSKAEIENTFALNKFLEKIKKVKILALVVESSLIPKNNRGDILRHLFTNLYSRFEDKIKLIDSMTIVVTQGTGEVKDPRFLIKKILQESKEIRPDKKFWLNHIDKICIVEFPSPQKNLFWIQLPKTQPILDAIQRMEYIKTPRMKNVFSGDSAMQIKSASDSVDKALQLNMEKLTKELKKWIKEKNLPVGVLNQFLSNMKKFSDEIPTSSVESNSQILQNFSTQIIENIGKLSDDFPSRIREAFTRIKDLITKYENVFKNVYISNKQGADEQLISLNSAVDISHFTSKIIICVIKLVAQRMNDIKTQEMIKEQEKKMKEEYQKEIDRIEEERKMDQQQINGKNKEAEYKFYLGTMRIMSWTAIKLLGLIL